MANQTGRPIAPARKLVAAVMGTIAVFVMALGLGMSSWGVVVFGLAVLVLSIALGMVNVVRRGARAWVAGTAEVKAISPPPASTSVYGRAEIQAVVVAPGLPTSEVMIREPRVPVVKWPLIGDTLPITVDVDDMRRVRINWDEASPRDRGADPPPPPPPAAYDTLPDDLDDDLDNDLLGDVEPPPWAARDPQWAHGPGEPPPPPPPGAASDYDRTVVVHDTPAGPIVEGQFVDHDDTAQRLPRRAPGAAAQTAPDEEAPTDEAVASGASRPAGTRPSPRPRGGSATASAEPRTAFAPTGTSQSTATAAPMPDQMPPAQRTAHPDEAIVTDIPLDDPQPAPDARDGDIDLPLDGDPDPAPETTPGAAEAVASDVIAPPAPPTVPADHPTMTFMSNAAHDASVAAPASAAASAPEGDENAARTAQADAGTDAPGDSSGHTGVMAGAAAAVGAAAAAAVAAVRRVGKSGRSDEEPPPQPTDEDPARHPPAAEPGHGLSEVITAYPSARPGPAAAIHGVGITVLVADLSRSTAFYRDTLGFYEIDSGRGGAVLASGDTRLVLRAVHDISAETGRQIYLNLEVGDVEAVYEELTAKGVRFVHGPRPVNRGDRLELWSATFRDPDDHNIAITQWRALR